MVKGFRKYYPLLFCLLIFLGGSAFAAGPFRVVYLSPYPGSESNTLTTNIIIRTNRPLDKNQSSDPEFLTVTGSKSGVHKGRLVLGDDGMTLLFYADNIFSEDETVTILSDGPVKSEEGETAEEISFTFGTMSISKAVRTPYGTAPELASTYSDIKMSPSDTLPSDFPQVKITVSDHPDSDYIFIGTTSTKAPYIMILDNSGKPVFYRRTPSGTYDFKPQPDGRLTYYDMKTSAFNVLDSSYRLVDSFKCGNGYYTDLHELRILPNGHALIIGFIDRKMDLSRMVEGGYTDAIVVGSVIQELDRNKNVIFQWRCQDYFNVTDSYADLKQNYIDFTHANAIDIDDDGDLLVSFRNMQEVTKIDRQSGRIIWRLGGRKNQFTFLNDPLPFSWQHAIRHLENGNYLLFDNGFKREKDYFSRAVEYRLDEKLKTATLIWQYRNNPDIYSYGLGYAQRLKNGNTFIGWGTELPSITEVRPDGTKAFEMSLPNGLMTYRAYRFPWKKSAVQSGSIGFSSVNINFDSIATGDTTSRELVIKNKSSLPIVLNSISNFSRDFYLLRGFPLSIEANDSVKLRIYFRPLSSGSHKDTLTINYGSTAENIILSGTASNETGIGENDEHVNMDYSLLQNYPNPFNQSTMIRYKLAGAGRVSLQVYNLLGQTVRTIVDEYKTKGSYTVFWDGRNNNGQDVKSGVYIYSIRAGHFLQSKKMIMLR